jgi:MFS family permease
VSRPRRARVAFVLVALLLDVLGFGLVVPVQPRLVAGFVHDDVGAASRYYGSFIAAYSAMQFLFAPVLGGLSDRFGRRPVILISLLGAALDNLLLCLAPNLAWLFVGRAIAGVTGARGELQGSLTSMRSLCAVAGPLLGAWLFARHAPESASPRIEGIAFFAAAAFNVAGGLLAVRLGWLRSVDWTG